MVARHPKWVIQATKEADTRLIPEQSKECYERVYNQFVAWRKENNSNSVSKRTLMVYISELSKSRKPTTSWAYVLMLKSMLKLNEDVDISKYPKVKVFLKKKSEGHKPMQAKMFSKEEIRKFIFEAPDFDQLATKVSP